MEKICIFLSYARTEASLVDGDASVDYIATLKEHLRNDPRESQYQINIFMDKNGIPQSQDWRQSILKEIAQSQVILVTATQAWFESVWCARELLEFARVGRRSRDNVNVLPTGRLVIPLNNSMANFQRVPLLRRFNARYASFLLKTRQDRLFEPTSEQVEEGLYPPKRVSEAIYEALEGINDAAPISRPSLTYFWRFLPVALKIAAAIVVAVALSIIVYLVRNYELDRRAYENQKGEFVATVSGLADNYVSMRQAVNLFLPPSPLLSTNLRQRMTTLPPNEGERFSLIWGSAANDIERYFLPLTACLETNRCAPVDHDELCQLAGSSSEGYREVVEYFGQQKRGFHVMEPGTELIVPVPLGSVIRIPQFIHTPRFFELACRQREHVVVGPDTLVVEPVSVCNDDLTTAVHWAERRIEAIGRSEEDIPALLETVLISRRLGEHFSDFDRSNDFAREFSAAMISVAAAIRPDEPADGVLEEYEDRLTRYLYNTSFVLRHGAQCLSTMFPETVQSAEDLPLGLVLSLDTFFHPDFPIAAYGLESVRADDTRRTEAELDLLFDYMNTIREGFYSIDSSDPQRCQRLVDGMLQDAYPSIRLRDRRSPSEPYRTLALSPEMAMTPFWALRDRCDP